MSRKFPEPLSKWALEEAESAQEKGKKKVAFPVDKLHHALKVSSMFNLLHCE